MKIWVHEKINKFYTQVRFNGLFLTLHLYIHKTINRVFTFFIFGRLDISIDAGAKLIGRKNFKIGKNFGAGKHLWMEAVSKYGNQCFTPKIIIKDNVSLSDFNHIGAVNYIEIGNNVLFGSHCYVTDHNHGIYSGDINSQSNPMLAPIKRMLTQNKKVIIGDNVWIGDNVIILPGTSIGEGTIIGANAVVASNVPAYSIAVGIPARVVKHWNFKNSSWEKLKGN